MTYRMCVSFEVTGTATHIAALSLALKTDKGRRWARHLLVSALEMLVRWDTGDGFWRFELGKATATKPEKVSEAAPATRPEKVSDAEPS